MANITNPWQDVFARSYQQIKKTILQKMRDKLPEVTDFSEGNIFIILISMFASVAEVIHYYLDNMARETFFSVARRYSSLIKHAKLVDYHIKAAIPASVDILFTIGENAEIATKTYIIPINTVLTGPNGLQFLTVKQKTFYEGTYGVSVPAEQKTYVPPVFIGNITDQNNIIYIDETEGLYVEGSAILRLNDILWTLVETFAYSNAASNHYMVKVDDSQRPYIEFGDGSFGAKPPMNATISLGYYITQGNKGNVSENTINTLSTKLDIEGVQVTNKNAAAGGSNYETFDMIKEHVPLSIKTLGVAITKEDYEAVAMLTPGVDKAYIDYKCGKFVDIYIVPDGGGIASEALRDNTERYISTKKLITTNIRILSTGSSYIYIDLTVTGNPAIRATLVSDSVTKALIDNYNFNTSNINKVVRLSDIYALIDGLDVVDYLTINDIYTIPYPVPEDDVNVDLNITYFKIKRVVDPVSLTVTYTGNNQFEIISDIGETFILVMGTPLKLVGDQGFMDFEMGIANPFVGNYSPGDRWTLNLIPNGKDQRIQDYSVPRIILKNISLEVIETV